MARRAPSISVRLTLWFGLALLLLLSAFAAFGYVSFHLLLHHDFDRHLQHEERALRPYVVLTAAGPSFYLPDELRSVPYQTDGVFGTYVRLFDAGGRERYRSPNFAGHESLPVALPGRAEAESFSRSWQGEPAARTRMVPLRAVDGSLAGWMELTGFEWSLHRGLHQLGWALVVGVLGSVVLALAGGYWLARRALRPVAALTEAADRMSAADLSARLPTDFGPPDELTDLAETFNGWLARLEASVERERRFSADAAHELMTPLAALRSEAEVALRRERSPEAYREVLGGVLLDTERLTATVQGLLRLARAERITPGPGERADLAAVAEARAEAHRARAEAKGLSLDVRTPPWPIPAAAAEAALVEVADNLLQNAIKYTPSGGRIEVAVSTADHTARLTVVDTGAGMSEEEARRAFERFYRSDAQAVQAEPGSGLGLAVVRAVVEAYGGSVRAESEGTDRGSRVEVTLPLA
jgi:heavy metal sensor kinase